MGLRIESRDSEHESGLSTVLNGLAELLSFTRAAERLMRASRVVQQGADPSIGEDEGMGNAPDIIGCTT